MDCYHVVSEATHHPAVALETLRQASARVQLFATMDPALKSYLDKFTETLTKASDDTRADIKELKAQIGVQTAQVEELVAWKPDLEARFSKLQEAVSLLQAAPPTSASAISGGLAAPDLPDPVARDEIHGPDGHASCNTHGAGCWGEFFPDGHSGQWYGRFPNSFISTHSLLFIHPGGGRGPNRCRDGADASISQFSPIFG